MNRIKSFALFEDDRIETDIFQGTPQYTKVVDYLALLTKTDAGQDKDPQMLINFLRSQGDGSNDVATGNVAEIFSFFADVLKHLKTANLDLYTKINGDQILMNLEKSKFDTGGKQEKNKKGEGDTENPHNLSTMPTEHGDNHPVTGSNN